MTEKIIKNPITFWIKESVNTSTNRLNFAVPFLSSFSLSILNQGNTAKISDKRIVTRFDETGINSFDLPTLKSLLDLGFDIRYDNNIHLKLYITDNEAYVTSSNLTKGGFEDNVELTTKVASNNVQTCADLFDEIWSNCKRNKLTYKLIDNSWAKYEVLRKRESYARKDKSTIKIEQKKKIGDIDIRQIINEAYKVEGDIIERIQEFSFAANKLREEVKDKLKKGFDKKIFYVPEGHKLRRENLFYFFVYGVEDKLAGVGLREEQYKIVFEHSHFKRVVEYIYPEILGMKPWNFNDKEVFREFCNGIFDFDIPNYKESMPIRLASYFYPEKFLPIFKLIDLEKISEAFGSYVNAETTGDKLFVYNSFLADKMKTLPYNNYVKSHIAYQIMYVVELYTRLRDGENYNEIYNGHKEKWKQRFIEKGMNILTKLKVVE